MKTLYAIVIFVVLTAISTVAYTDQVPVNIVYPINGEIYPEGGLDCEIDSYYQTASFSVTCPGKDKHQVDWGIDGDHLGSANFYDQMSMQFVWNLPVGGHVFWVKSDCGENEVKFEIK